MFGWAKWQLQNWTFLRFLTLRSIDTAPCLITHTVLCYSSLWSTDAAWMGMIKFGIPCLNTHPLDCCNAWESKTYSSRKMCGKWTFESYVWTCRLSLHIVVYIYLYRCLYRYILNLWRKQQVLLLDEVTVDLDVVTRMDLLSFFKEECEQVEF